MANSSDKSKYFSEMFQAMGMGSITLYMNGGIPLQIALSENGKVVASDPATGVSSEILLSDRHGNLKAKLVYSTEKSEWVIAESY